MKVPSITQEISSNIGAADALDTDALDPCSALLLEILARLKKRGAVYALIHGDTGALPDIASDIDMAFAEPPPGVIEPVLMELANTGKASIIQRLHYEIPHGYYYILKAAGTSSCFLHLDCLYDPLGVNRYHLSTSFLLDGTTDGSWAKRVEREKEAVYLLMKRAIKGRVSQKGLGALRSRFHEASDVLWSDIQTWFGPEARQQVENLLRCENPEQAGFWLAELRVKADSHFRWRRPIRYVMSSLMGGIRKLRRLVSPTGLFVVILGPDGSGKSTVAGLVLSQLERAFRRTWRFHWRPGLLSKLRRGASPNSNSAGTFEAPNEVSKYRGLVSLARFVYYWLDFVIGYWLIIYPRKAQTTLVIGERYFPDVLVHPQRYGFAVPKWLMRLAAKAVPSPDLLILLKDTPEIIYARKPELHPDIIAKQISEYEHEMNYWGGGTVVTTRGGAESVAEQLNVLILKACARRTAQRMRRATSLEWRAFPSVANPKVWVSNEDNLRNALNLYHPYSISGCIAKSLASYLPQIVHRWLLPRISDADAQRQLQLLTQIISKTLDNEGLTVSFSTGTAGPHRKLTAQASLCGEVKAYIKIAQGPITPTLLRQEAWMLNWLHENKFSGAAVPKVLAVTQQQGYTLLFLSAPLRPGKTRPMEADDLATYFLLSLGSMRKASIPLKDVLDGMGFAAAHERIKAVAPEAADVLQQAVERLQGIFNSVDVKVSPSHGDYAPWNALELDGGSLYVFDWEYANLQSPCLNDAFHRVFMPARLVSRQSPHHVVYRMMMLYQERAFASVLRMHGIRSHEIPSYLLIYLVTLFVRQWNSAEKQDEYLLNCVRAAMKLMQRMQGRRKVLVAAYACEPGRGSEPGVGWHMSEAISREHEAWIITRKNNQAAIEKELSQRPNPYLHFYYVDLPLWARFWKKGGRGIRTYYYLWQFAALREAKRLNRHIKFDIAHHVTFVNDYIFSFLAFLPIPFIWGPLGSHHKIPYPLADGWFQLIKDRMQHFFKFFLRTADPLFWLCAIKAKLIIVIDKGVPRKFPLSLLARKKFIRHPAIGVEQQFEVKDASTPALHETFRILSMGKLVPIKSFHLTLRAFANLVKTVPTAHLTIVGDGPLKPHLLKLAVDLGIKERTEFIGWLPRAEAMSFMSQSDVFLYPSFESSGMVVLEAMAHGMPVVCLEGGGPAELVTNEAGIIVEDEINMAKKGKFAGNSKEFLHHKGDAVANGGDKRVKIGSMDYTVKKLGDALSSIIHDAELRLIMSTAARQNIRDKYLWERRHDAIRLWYLMPDVEAETLSN